MKEKILKKQRVLAEIAQSLKGKRVLGMNMNINNTLIDVTEIRDTHRKYGTLNEFTLTINFDLRRIK